MGVVVDKAGCDDAARGVDGTFGGSAGIFADPDNLAVLDRDIRGKCRLARAVDNAPVFNEQIIGHAYSSLLPPAPNERSGLSQRAAVLGRMARQRRFARCEMTLRREGRSDNRLSQNATRVCDQRRSAAKMFPSRYRVAQRSSPRLWGEGWGEGPFATARHPQVGRKLAPHPGSALARIPTSPRKRGEVSGCAVNSFTRSFARMSNKLLTLRASFDQRLR